MRTLSRIAPQLALPLLFAGGALAQAMPATQPGVLDIIVEELKPGTDADHEANEAGWPVAFAKAGSANYYLALESMTGPREIWFVSAYPSFAGEAAAMKAMEGDATLVAEMTKLARNDGQYLSGTRRVKAVGRPDLSHGQFPDLAMARFYDISTFRARLGREQGFENAAKAYAQIMKRTRPNASYRVYQVVAGMPAGTYLIFSTRNAYEDYDRELAEEQAMWQQVTPEEMTPLQQAMANDMQMVLTHRFRVSPSMSYVSAEARAKDPKFWK